MLSQPGLRLLCLLPRLCKLLLQSRHLGTVKHRLPLTG